MTPKVTIVSAGLVVGVAAAWVAAGPHRADPTDPRGDLSPALVAANSSVIEKVVAKQEATTALLRGEFTLVETAARFQATNGANSVVLDRLREFYPGAGDDELIFRQVLHFARWDRRVSPDVVAARLPQLEAEFRARFPTAHPLRPMNQAVVVTVR